MIIAGLVLLAAAVAAAAILIMQNRASMVHVHALGHTWSGHPYWVLVTGLIIALTGVLGVAVIRGDLTRVRRQRQERAQLMAENKQLSERVGNPDASPFFSGDAAATDTKAPGADPTGKARSFRRGRHAS